VGDGGGGSDDSVKVMMAATVAMMMVEVVMMIVEVMRQKQEESKAHGVELTAGAQEDQLATSCFEYHPDTGAKPRHTLAMCALGKMRAGHHKRERWTG
jgi:hypothetical protein